MSADETARAGKPRVAMLTSVHAWHDVRIFLKQARTLAAAGYKVTVIAPGEGSRVVDGVSIEAIPRTNNRAARMLASPWRLLVRARRHDICHFHDPELIPLAFVLKLMGKRVVYDVHEDLPRDIEDKPWIAPGLRPSVARMAAAAEWLAARIVDRVVAATPTIARRFPSRKTVVAQNFPLSDELATPDATPYRDRPLQVAYVGGLTVDRGAHEMVAAAGLMRDGEPAVALAGPPSPPALLQRLEREPGWSACRYLGVLDRAGVSTVLGQARAGLVLMHPTGNYVNALPTKMFEYMSAGLPVIASDFPIWREIVDGVGAGLLVDPRDPAAIAAAIRHILDDPAEAEAMGRRGRAAVEATYNWEAEAPRLIACYETITRRAG